MGTYHRTEEISDVGREAAAKDQVMIIIRK
jgi:hypothetical protein